MVHCKNVPDSASFPITQTLQYDFADLPIKGQNSYSHFRIWARFVTCFI